MSKRDIDYRFKFLYVIGIISVVFGHSGYGISLFYDWFPPYSFHLPLFAFCSGYFYNEASTDHVLKYILHKVKRLIVPFYLWNFFYGMFIVFVHQFGFNIGWGVGVNLYNLLIEPIYGGHQFLYNLGGWFVVPLFMVQIFNVLLRKLLAFIRIRINEYLLFSFSFILGITGVNLGNLGYAQNCWWLFLIRILCIMPFYEFAILYKNKLEKKDYMPNVVYFGLILCTQLLIITFNGGAITYSLSWCSDFPDNVFMPYIQSTIAIMFWLRVSRILLPIIENNKFILIISDNTYSIMINQYLGFMLIKTIFAVIHKYTIFCRDFNMSEYKNVYNSNFPH